MSISSTALIVICCGVGLEIGVSIGFSCCHRRVRAAQPAQAENHEPTTQPTTVEAETTVEGSNQVPAEGGQPNDQEMINFTAEGVVIGTPRK